MCILAPRISCSIYSAAMASKKKFEFPEDNFLNANCQIANRALWLFRKWIKYNENIHREGDWLLNTKTHIGMLCKAARYKRGSNRTIDYKIGRDNTEDNEGLYYVSQTKISILVSMFFRAHPTYHLLIDLCTKDHQTALYVIRHPTDGYKFYAFDPNKTCNTMNIVDTAKEIRRGVDTINIWSSFSMNYDGLCYTLTWRFIHKVMFENFEPVGNERIVVKYNVRLRTPEAYTPADDEPKLSTIGYRRHGETFVIVNRQKQRF